MSARDVHFDLWWRPSLGYSLILFLPLTTAVFIVSALVAYGNGSARKTCDGADRLIATGRLDEAEKALTSLISSADEPEDRRCVLDSLAGLGTAQCQTFKKLSDDPEMYEGQLESLQLAMKSSANLPQGCEAAGVEPRTTPTSQIGRGDPATEDIASLTLGGINRLLEEIGFDFTAGPWTQALGLLGALLVYATWVKYVRRHDPGVVVLRGIFGTDGKNNLSIEHVYRRYVAGLLKPLGVQQPTLGDVKSAHVTSVIDISVVSPSVNALVSSLRQIASQRPEFEVDGVVIDDHRMSLSIRGAVDMPPETFGHVLVSNEFAAVLAAHRTYDEIFDRLVRNEGFRVPPTEEERERIRSKQMSYLGQLLLTGNPMP